MSVKSLLKLLVLLKKILKGDTLDTVPLCYSATKNLLIGEDIYVFEQKFLEKVKTMVAIDYKLVMQGLMNNLFPMEELQLHNRYLHWGGGLIPITLQCLSSYNALKCL